MRTVKHPLTGELLFPEELPSMTKLDRMRQELSNAIAKRMHKHIKPHPYAVDEDDVLVEREGWLTEDELKAAAWIILYENSEKNATLQDLHAEALKRNIV